MFVVTEPATIAQSSLETKTCCKRPERVGREFRGYTRGAAVGSVEACPVPCSIAMRRLESLWSGPSTIDIAEIGGAISDEVVVHCCVIS